MTSVTGTIDFLLPVLLAGTDWFARLPGTVQWLLAIWVFSLGACFGSFMNVVIYRLPAGLNIAYPGSRCPRCLHAIRGYDNLPIFSWLILRGRCRDCGLPFSARYPLIEAFVAITVLCIAVFDVYFSDGSYVHWLQFVAHTMLICTLICATMIEYDGHVPPRNLFFPALLVGLACPFIWPLLGAYELPVSANWFWTKSVLNAVLSSLVGAGLGLLLIPVARHCKGADASHWPLPWALAMCGATLGATVAAQIAMQTAVALLIVLLLRSKLPSLTHFPVFGYITLLCGIAIALERPFIAADVRSFQPVAPGRREFATFASFAFLLIASWIAKRIARQHSANAFLPKPPEESRS